MPAFSKYMIALYQHGPHHRVGRDMTGTVAGELQATLHPLFVG